ncbi:MAG: polysaccharide biosynthesis C-terminal domain-containing protein [Ignavibacteria bacterium]
MENNSHIKKLFSHTVIYGLGIVLNRSVNFILLPVYTNYYTPEEIGMLTLLQSLSFFLMVIYALGMETSFMKFFIEEKDVKKRSEIYSSTLIFLLIFTAVISSAIYFFSESIVALFDFTDIDTSILLLKILCVLMVADTVYRFPLLLFRAELKAKTYAYINLLTFVVNIIANLILIVFLKMGIEAILYSYLLSVFITLLVSIIITSKYLTMSVSLSRIKEMLKFGNKFIYIGLCLILIDMSDRFFLKYFFNEKVVGIYWANYRLATVMSLVIAAFKFSWTPYFLNLSDNPENKKIISNIFTYFCFAGLSLFLIFSLLINQFVKIDIFGMQFLDEKFMHGLSIVPLVLLAYFFSGAYSTLNAAPFFTDKTFLILFISAAGLLINLALNYLLIPILEMNGAALSTLITYFAMFLIMYYYSQKIYRIDYEWKKIFKIGFLTMVFFAAGFMLGKFFNETNIILIIVNLILITIFFYILNTSGIIKLRSVLQLLKKSEKN